MVFEFSKVAALRKLSGGKYGAGVLAAVLAFGLSTSVIAAPWVLDFDTDSAGNANAITNGQIIDDEYASQIAGAAPGVGVTISAFTGGWGHSSKHAVAFPSNNDYADTTPTHEDYDLRHVNDDYRNILIIQEDQDYNDPSSPYCTSNVCASPDDNAGGGWLKFVFTTAVNLTGMNYFDIDGNEGASKVWLFSDGEQWGDPGAESIDLPITGNGGVGFIGFGDKGLNITMMKVFFEHSGAVDNITGQTGTQDQVPEPGALAIILTGLLGYGLSRRRRSGVVTA